MIDNIIQLLKEEDGQSMVEYGIILALISTSLNWLTTGIGIAPIFISPKKIYQNWLGL